MTVKGFFGGGVWSVQKTPLPLIPECDACGLYKHCQSPRMPVSGLGHRRVLILAEGPGYKEDEQGIQLVGLSGQKLAELLDKIDVSLRRDCWLDNAIRCRKTDANGDNLEPKDKEIGHCRANL